MKGEKDNPTIGILLCTETDKTMARYSVLHENKQLFATIQISTFNSIITYYQFFLRYYPKISDKKQK